MAGRAGTAAQVESPVAAVLRAALRRGELTQAETEHALARLEAAPRGARAARNTRREDILAAATRIFATRGYHAATLQDIAEALGLTRPAFYYYFQSKQEILEAICLGAAERTDALVQAELARPAPDAATQLRQVFAAYAAHIAAQESTTVMMRNYEEMSAATRAEITERRRAREALVEAVLRRGITDGSLSAPHPRIAILAAFEMLHSVHAWFNPTGRLRREEVGMLLADQLLQGMARPVQAAG